MRWILCFFVSSFSLYATTLSDFIAIDSSLKSAQVGVSVIDVDTGNEVFAKRSDKNFVPGSLMKIPLAAALYAHLGKEHVFETKLTYTGSVNGAGVLDGDIIIVGGGDPTLKSSIINEWAQSVSLLGISSITGQIIADASAFESILSSPSWEFEDLSSYYSGVASGLSIDGNMYEVLVRGGKKAGDPSLIEQVGKKIPGLLLFNEVSTGGTLPKSNVFGGDYSPLQIFRGSVPANMQYSMRGALPDPARFTGELLRAKLGVQKEVKTIRNKGTNSRKMLLHTHKSEPLSGLVRTMCRESNNLYAHHLIKHLGKGFEKEGLKNETKFLNGLGISMNVADGPGLSRRNFGTPHGFAKLVRILRTNPSTQDIVDSFSELGVSGALKSLPIINGARVLAKTGTLVGVTNLCGIIQLDTGKEYSFSFFVNHHTATISTMRRLIRNFIEELVKELR